MFDIYIYLLMFLYTKHTSKLFAQWRDLVAYNCGDSRPKVLKSPNYDSKFIFYSFNFNFLSSL